MTTVNITADMLPAGPMLLSQADTTYVLQCDVTAQGSAFIIGARNVVFDLNGHTVTFGAAPSPSLLNGGFEVGDVTNVPGWDLSQAPAGCLLPAQVGMWGKGMLHLNSFTTKQVFTSEPIVISQLGTEHVGTITPKGTNGCKITLNVIDAKTGLVLASDDSTNVSTGYSFLAPFIPTTNLVRLEVIAEPAADKPAVVDFDFAQVFRAMDFGVIASISSWNFPKQLQTTAIKNTVKSVANVTIKNGSIIQGAGAAYDSAALFCLSTPGVKIVNVKTFVNGMDSTNIEGAYASRVSITDCFFDNEIQNISNRKRVFGCIKLSKNKGDVEVSGNTILNSPQAAIAIDGNSDGAIFIIGNTITQRAIVSNAYGVISSGIHNFTIAGNNISGVGRGLSFDSWDAAPSSNGKVFNNDINIRLGGNLEYPASASVLAASVLRLRTNGQGVLRDLHIHDNKFTTTTGEGLSQTAIGARISLKNFEHRMDSCGIVIENNLFKAIVTTTDPKYRAWALSVAGIDALTGVMFRNNTFESNDVALQLGEETNYRLGNADITFLGNKFVKSSEGAARNFRPVQAGDGKNSLTDIRIFDSGLTAADIYWLDTAEKEIKLGHTTTVVDAVITQSGKNPPEVSTP